MHPKKLERYRDVETSVKWSQNVLSHAAQYLLIDAEYDFEEEESDITEIAVCTISGEPIFEQKLRETEEKSDLSEVWAQIVEIQHGRQLITFNEDPMSQHIEETLERQGAPTSRFRAHCLMEKYTAYKNVWNSEFDDYKWQKLPGKSTGSAAADCRRMAALLMTMQAMPEKYSGLNNSGSHQVSKIEKKENGNIIFTLLNIFGGVVKTEQDHSLVQASSKWANIM